MYLSKESNSEQTTQRGDLSRIIPGSHRLKIVDELTNV